MLKLGTRVEYANQTGRIVGRTIELQPKYDIMLANGTIRSYVREGDLVILQQPAAESDRRSGTYGTSVSRLLPRDGCKQQGKRRRGGMRILIVEDDRLLAASLGMMLESAGHEVVGHAVTVRAAMDLARSHSPDLTLMDIDLGLGGSGIAAARGMKKHHGLVSLFVTDQPDRARQAADASLGVLAKPYDRDTVLRTLEVASLVLARQPPGDLPAGLEIFPEDAAPQDATMEMGR